MKEIVIKEEDVLTIVCACLNMTPEDIFKKTRVRVNVIGRQIFHYMMCKYSNYSLAEIGEISSKHGRDVPHDHATVLHSRRTIKNAIDMNDYRIIEKLKLIEREFIPHKVRASTGKKLIGRDSINAYALLKDLRTEHEELKVEMHSLQVENNILRKIASTNDNRDLLRIYNELDEDGRKDLLYKAQTIKKVREKLMRVPA